MILGQKVFTVNAKTNSIDSWEYAGEMFAKTERLIHLVNGKKQCVLPARCVFDSEEKARAVANDI